jgi:uncharacterized protein (DUF58 family)
MRRIQHFFQFIKVRIMPWWQIQRAEGGAARIRLNSPAGLVAFGIGLLWYIARPSAVAVVAVIGLGGLLGAGYFYARRMALGLFARRRLSYAAIQVGDEIEEIVTLINRSAFPALWVEFADQSNIPGYSLTSVRAGDSKSSLEWRVHAICTLRGNYHFGPWAMHTSDPFGLFRVTIAYDQKEEILVYPPLAALPAELLPRGRSLGDDRPLLQPLQAESMSALTTRPLIPGDPLRRVHWPTTARRDSLYVKTFDPEASSTLWLIPDLDRSVQRGVGPDSTLETMIILLASLASRFLNERMAVGLIAYAHSPQLVMPSRDKSHLWQILRLLAGLETSPLPLAQTLAHARTLISGRQRVILVTPSLQPAWTGELQRLGGASRRSGAEVILLDPHSFEDAPGQESGTGVRLDEAGNLLTYFSSLGIAARVLRRGDIQPFSASYGELNRWEFKTGGTGRAFARRAPRSPLFRQPPTAPTG